jgi:phosphate starvation-inducible PhoH-like protein
VEVARGMPANAADTGAPSPLKTRRHDLHGRTPRQIQYLEQIQRHDITFAIGPAGTGKTYLAVACAVDALERDRVKRLVLVRPAVEAGERLGFLPGSFNDKVDPYMRPLYDAMDKLLGRYSAKRELINKAVEIAPLAYMLGRTFDDSVCVLDEAQNANYMQLRLFLTRFGTNTKVIITGDPPQCNLPMSPAPIKDVIARVKDIRGVGHFQFSNKDVVRHPLISAILDKI